MDKTLHMIGNAHLDPVWMWRWPEGCAEAIGTCWAAVDRLEEDGGFVFTRGEAQVYQWVEELDPALFARIRALVAEGRWVIVGGWWVQPDCNLPGGEAFLRQALYGKRYFRDRFGVEVRTGFNVDSFGHAGTLPMLLGHTGYEHYVFMRPMPHEKDLPGHLFDWRAPDGSSVLAFRIPFAYTTIHCGIEEQIERHLALLDGAETPLMCFYGVGNHGGGPTRANLRAIRVAAERGLPVRFSDPVRYFEAVAGAERPAVQDELQHHAVGCYSAVSALKALNRRAEAALAQAEAAAALALRHVGAPYPHATLEGLWRTLLFNQFHDTLGGTSLPSATDDAIAAYGAVLHGAAEVMNAGVRRLATTVAPPADPEDASVLIINLTGVEQGMVLAHEPWLDWDDRSERHLLDGTGAEVPFQRVAPEGHMGGLTRILFRPTIPAFGYELFRLRRGAPTTSVAEPVAVSERVLESRRWRLELDAATGAISALIDKAAGRAVFAGLAHLPLAVPDPTDTWGHGVDRFPTDGSPFVAESFDVREEGPLRAALRVRTRWSSSTVTHTYRLCADPDLPIEISVEIDWHDRRHLLRLRYPLALPEPEFRAEAPYGSLARPADGREWPGHRWVLASGAEGYGVLLVNDAKYAYAAEGGTLHVTALRSPAFAHHDPFPLAEQQARFVDQGRQEMTVRLLAGPGLGPREAHLEAEALLRPPVMTPHVARTGRRANQGRLLALEIEDCLVTWLKAAEEGDGLVLRVLECRGLARSLVIDGRPVGEMAPHGLATLRLDPEGQLRRSDGLER